MQHIGFLCHAPPRPAIYYIKLRALYTLFSVYSQFLIKFSGLLRHNHTCHTFFERLKFLILKFEKATSKNLNDEEHGK